jgi:hypothetical protein
VEAGEPKAVEAPKPLAEDEVRELIEEASRFQDPVTATRRIPDGRDGGRLWSVESYLLASASDAGVALLRLYKLTRHDYIVERYGYEVEVYGRANPSYLLSMARRLLERRRRYGEAVERFKRGEATLKEVEQAYGMLENLRKGLALGTRKALETLARHGIEVEANIRLEDPEEEACKRLCATLKVMQAVNPLAAEGMRLWMGMEG